MTKFSQRMNDIEPFRVVEVLTRAKELETQGRSIMHLEAGEPDFDTAQPIVDAGIAALQAGQTHYTPACGIPELRQAISRFYKDDYGLNISPQRIMITPGASGALMLVAALLTDPGDSMIMPDPGYPCNRQFIRLVEGFAQLLPVDAAQRYQLTADAVLAAWQPSTVGVVVASPANPTGEILTASELTELYKVVSSGGGTLIVDEIYHGLDYDEKAASILSITADAFVINSFSKYFGMTGWRLGWLVAPEEAVVEMERLAQNLFISMSTPAQYAALACFEPATRQILDDRRDIFKQRRDYLLSALRDIGFHIPNKPAGALYLYADASKFTDDCQKFCIDLLENHGVALTPGVDFGSHRSNTHVRFAYTTSMECLKEAVSRLRKALN
ncbi:MAG: aspartate/methionine/tyrosine aminotransferase [Pseudomonadales bacterium]|jgi:aspartate/methionine/tyrosine aminotransferase